MPINSNNRVNVKDGKFFKKKNVATWNFYALIMWLDMSDYLAERLTTSIFISSPSFLKVKEKKLINKLRKNFIFEKSFKFPILDFQNSFLRLFLSLFCLFPILRPTNSRKLFSLTDLFGNFCFSSAFFFSGFSGDLNRNLSLFRKLWEICFRDFMTCQFRFLVVQRSFKAWSQREVFGNRRTERD